MKNKLTFLGHASIKIESATGTVIYIDPAFPCDNYQQEADIILVTHHHGDHDLVDLVTKKEDCVILDNKVMLIDGVYQEKEFAGIKVKAVPAYNKNHKKEENVGYIIFLQDTSIYIAGDTSKTDEMESFTQYDLDYAVLPIDGYYNMGPLEAKECVELIKAKTFIPIHNDPRSIKDGKEYDTNFDVLEKENALIVHHGETIEL